MVYLSKRRDTMKRLLIGLVATVAVLGLSTSAFALAKASDGQFIVKQDQVIDDDVYVAAENVVIEGIVNGDVYAAGDRVTVRGTVNGDVFAAGSLVEVSGVISDDLRAAAETITINSSAKIGDSLTAGASEVSVSKDSTIGGGVLAGAAFMQIDGTVGRGITIGAERLTVNSRVEGDILADVSDLNFGENADIGGSVKYKSGSEADIDDGAQFAEQPELEEKKTKSFGSVFAAHVSANVYSFAAAFVTGVVLVLISKRHVRQISRTIREKLAPTTGYGLLFVFAGIPLAVLMMLTLVGIPLGIITLLLWGISLYLAKIFAGVALGEWIIRRMNSDKKKFVPGLYSSLAVGLGVYYLVMLVPFINFFVGLLFTAAGLGALVLEINNTRKHHKQAK